MKGKKLFIAASAALAITVTSLTAFAADSQQTAPNITPVNNSQGSQWCGYYGSGYDSGSYRGGSCWN
ncbi:hypothetical protein [Pectinatus frisingensis]|uniref:hypothetical protein n=1 Tax=Pectinatus frisingensis TaxID=865 RepID=UPI0018C55807|nr:hypothetical protein [Pectinatus frisingensis]